MPLAIASTLALIQAEIFHRPLEEHPVMGQSDESGVYKSSFNDAGATTTVAVAVLAGGNVTTALQQRCTQVK